MNRRQFLALGAAGVSGLTAGCGGLLQQQSTGRVPPVVENRPDAVYVPSHVEGMEMIGMQSAGDRMVALTYSFPHRFWTVEGFGFEDPTQRVELQDDDSVHLMASVFDPETGTVLPTDADLRMHVTRDGETVDDKRPWPMLSQNMGFHFGENIGLDGDGTYTVEVEVGAVGAELLGDLAGKFGETASASFEFEFSQESLDGISYERLSDRQGERGAADRMDGMEMPLSTVPEVGSLPGNPTEAGLGDVTMVAFVQETDDGRDLVVSPRTPYNRFGIPFMALSAEADGESVGADSELTAAIHPDLGYHYRGALPEGVSGEAVVVEIVTPSTVSRHEGYETAFLETGTVSMTL
jgi:hypothetical protein